MTVMTEHIYFGVDIGGTKIATTVGRHTQSGIDVGEKSSFSTIPGDPKVNISRILASLQQFREKFGLPDAIGVSCGGPLNTDTGVILYPPNLPGWDSVPIVQILQDHLHAPAYLENDANACALAEYRFGAGRGSRNMIFLTFGTGMGAGLVLDGRLYRGSSGGAGEVGHIRLAEDGPMGFGKRGSFEGFCSGGGLAQLGRDIVNRKIAAGTAGAWARRYAPDEAVTAKDIVDAAAAGDADALEVMNICGTYLGRGLSALIDILNPDVIVIGSIFERSGDLLVPAMQAALREEALAANAKACRIVPSQLRESLGDYAALSIACAQAPFDKPGEGAICG